jgi:hypothetical protein
MRKEKLLTTWRGHCRDEEMLQLVIEELCDCYERARAETQQSLIDPTLYEIKIYGAK